MSLIMMKEAVRISDSFCNLDSAGSIDRQGRLVNILVLTVIFHAIIGVALYKMDEYERSRPRAPISAVQFQVDLTGAEEPVKHLVPRAVSFFDGVVNPGNRGARPQPAEKLSVLAAPPRQEFNSVAAPTPAVASGNASQALPPADRTDRLADKPAVIDVPAVQPGNSSGSPAGGTPVDGSRPDDLGRGIEGQDLTGTSGTGEDEGTDGPGREDGFGGGEQLQLALVQPLRPAEVRGNIAPYRRQMLTEIARNWRSTRSVNMKLRLVIAKDGQLLECRVLSSACSKRARLEALEAVNKTVFPPLPAWFRSESLNFDIDLQTAE